MNDPDNLGQSINTTTEHMNEIVSNINTREMDIDSKKRKLEKIKQAEIERNRHLQVYLEQLSSKSALLKDAESQFVQERKEADEKLSSEIQESITKIDNNIQTLKKMQQEKAQNEQEINSLKDQINQFEEELLALEKKDLEAEQILYEMVTRPFTNEEITHEIQQTENTDKAAVEAMLNLTIKTIYNLRQKISEEKKKTVMLKDEFHKVVKEIKTNDQISYENQLNKDDDLLLYYNPLTGKVDMTQFNQVDSRVKALKRREKRIDKEIDEINSKKPQFRSKFTETKLNIEKINNEKQKYESQLLNFKVDFNPEYNTALTSQIEQVQTNRSIFERKLKKWRQKIRELESNESQLHRTLRSLTELEIEAEQKSLQIASLANENHRIETENAQREHEERMNEQMLVNELSDLQRRIALNSAEFEEMIQKHENFERSVLNDFDWMRSNLIPPELQEATKHSEVTDFGLEKRFLSTFSKPSFENSNSEDEKSGLNETTGSSSLFSFTQSDKSNSNKINHSKSEKTVLFKNRPKPKIVQKKNGKSKSDTDDDDSEFGLLKVDSKLANKIARMKQSKERIRRESLKILAQVRSLSEAREFTMKEVRVMQNRLNQESFNLQKLQIEASKSGYINQGLLSTQQTQVRATDVISEMKERISEIRQSLRERRNKIDHKSEILHRIEKVNPSTNINSNHEIQPLFLIEDGERVVDRFLARKRLCERADRKVEVAKDVLDGFCELYQKVRDELRTWKVKVAGSNIDYMNYAYLNDGQSLDQKVLMKEWIDFMQESCKRFRNSGI
ncbi:hypothetical protein M9Y10_002993 [Tritrichomonas musculus]|uniref:Uncharacterized protein n=1 Tax=Tritrichomonas musculus TaxID=1915356 RepID=A0ABR2LC28_9EUKA